MSKNQKQLFQSTVFAVISIVMNIAILNDIKTIAVEIITMESHLLQAFCCLTLSGILATLPITIITWYKSIKG